ncbi:COG0488: ATPase components of ABC transporters with duplicated ATPase domains [Richelia intracellularis HH01]|uniref:COG0488: ATPase components of ABC transporters with duplicated ATPase domains n=1 Tax=Richelia intracellularis HH01 TaxID=1165094 RepID=M1X5T8_9NOST|nr:ABC-F family ATP-binding cassette domain-containing protein [Richelia intracellularis]CCH67606.1 COG0488: ATPase components of ABC transporters with duplicated ATPase domains [Richelia intracellularis HH01]HAE06307.1 ABC transporter ATP-binding protein [Richelia sp.]
MGVITLQSVAKDFGIKEILKEASFSLDANDKVGFIGTNGSGKSTLLKIIAGLETIDSGTISVTPNTSITYLPQQPDLDPECTVLEEVFAGDGEQMALIKKYEYISRHLALNPEDEDLMFHLSSVMQKMDVLNAWNLETNAKIILSKLGITHFDAKVGTLSGGYRKRIALATALLSEPDFLLMDEPTNHLDAESVEWLQSYLNHYHGALLLITHDRYFLDRVTNRIIEIDRGDVYSYPGSYSYYLEKKALAEGSIASSKRKLQGILRRELEWLKRGPKARSTKQKARIERIQSMQATKFKKAQEKVDISTPSRRIGKKVIELNSITKIYSNHILIQDFTYEFSSEDRIGIIGGNGVGKSTLMDMITGRLQPDAGKVEIGTTIHIGYFDQHSEDLLVGVNDSQRVIDYVKEKGGEYIQESCGNYITASQMLERFLFNGSQQYSPINKLSGGEKRRLFLLRVLMSAPNVLILDEPTNDLDVQTLAVLEEYLEEFNGCIIIVSHDRYFLDRTIDKVFVFSEKGKIREYPGNYSIYLDHKRAEEDEQQKNSKVTENNNNKSKKILNNNTQTPQEEISKRHRLSNWQRKEFISLEDKIMQLELKKSEVEAEIERSTDINYSQIQIKYDQLEVIKHEIDVATERWLELAEINN